MIERLGGEQLPPQHAVEIAGALQGVYSNLHERDFLPDIHQDAAIQALGTALISGETNGYVEMATGTGKTLLISLLADAATKAGKRTLIVAPQITIADQIVGQDGETGIGRFTDMHNESAVKQHYGQKRANKNCPVVVTTYQGMTQEAMREDSKLGEFDLILADECHRGLGPAVSKAISEYMPNAIKYGFSASPDFAEDRKSEEIFGKSLFEFSLRSAVESGVTAPVRALVLETETELKLTEYSRDYRDSELAPLINLMERNGQAVKLTRDLVAAGRQGIVACVPGKSNAHARLMAEYLSQTELESQGRNIIAAEVGSHLSKDEVAQRLKAYRAGEIDVLTFTRSLQEGWDSDKASFAINMAPTTSPLRTKQLLGRVMRKKRDDAESIYVDFVDKKSGVVREQYTAMHALDVEHVEINRVLGREHVTSHQWVRNVTDLSALLSPEIYGQLLRSQGKVLKELMIPKSKDVIDQLTAHWEKRLAEEGMPAEPPYNDVIPPQVAKRFGRVFMQMAAEQERDPLVNEVLERLKTTREAHDALAKYAIRETWDDEIIDHMYDEDLSLEEHAEAALLKDQLRTVLDTLNEREAGVISMRFGLTDSYEGGAPRYQDVDESGRSILRYDEVNDSNYRESSDGFAGMTLDAIGRIYGVGRERIRKVELKAMENLKHRSRSDILYGYIDSQDVASDPDEKPEYSLLMRHTPNSFGEIWGRTPSVFMDEMTSTDLENTGENLMQEYNNVSYIRDKVVNEYKIQIQKSQLRSAYSNKETLASVKKIIQNAERAIYIADRKKASLLYLLKTVGDELAQRNAKEQDK